MLIDVMATIIDGFRRELPKAYKIGLSAVTTKWKIYVQRQVQMLGTYDREERLPHALFPCFLETYC